MSVIDLPSPKQVAAFEHAFQSVFGVRKINRGSTLPPGPPPCMTTCKTCKVRFATRPSLLKRGWGKYCSRKCAGTALNVKLTRKRRR